jgi:hypothetical protein
MSRRALPIVGIAAAIAVAGLVIWALFAPSPPTGPLAIVEPQAGSPQARTEGVLQITDDCVSLVHPDGTSTLVIWIRDSTTWNATDRSIAVKNANGGQLNLHTGDPIVLSGGGGSSATIDNAGRWVRRPADACQHPNWFLAVDVAIGS